MIALGAESIEKELVPGLAKATRQFRLERRNTSFEFIQLFTSVALEVVVMLFPSYFISRRMAGNLYRLQPALIHQGLNVSIDRSLAECRVMTLRSLQNLVRREWPIGFDKGVADGRLLPCVDLFFHRN